MFDKLTTVKHVVVMTDRAHMPASSKIPKLLCYEELIADKPGTYRGVCAELCGKDHAFMPIAIRVVTDEQYATWLQAATSDLSGANRALMAAVDGAPAAVQTAENITN